MNGIFFSTRGTKRDSGEITVAVRHQFLHQAVILDARVPHEMAEFFSFLLHLLAQHGDRAPA